MCIHCLGHLSPLLPPHPLASRQIPNLFLKNILLAIISGWLRIYYFAVTKYNFWLGSWPSKHKALSSNPSTIILYINVYIKNFNSYVYMNMYIWICIYEYIYIWIYIYSLALLGFELRASTTWGTPYIYIYIIYIYINNFFLLKWLQCSTLILKCQLAINSSRNNLILNVREGGGESR
jgi:hypothetical protein